MDKKCMPEVCVKIHYTCFWHYFIFTDKKDRSLIQIGFFFVIKKRIFAEVGFQRLNLRVYGYRFFNLNTMVMNLVLAIIPVLLLIILMAFFKMSGDKSSVISLVVTMLIAFFGFHFPVNDLLSSFLYGALKAVSPILIIILMAIFSYNVLLKTEKWRLSSNSFLLFLPIKVFRYCC